MEFLSTGQKIRKIRKFLKLNQEDLATEGITRPFISMLESEKRSISYKKAKILAEIFNKRVQKLNVDLNVDPDYILNTPTEDASKYCFGKLIEANSISDIEDIIKISTKYNLEEISAKAYHKLGDLYFRSNNYTYAFEEYIRELDIYLDNNNNKLFYEDLYNILGKCKMKLLQYHDALFYFQRANHYSTIHNNSKIQRLSLYNLGLCFKKLNNIDNSLKYITEFLKHYNGFKYHTSTQINIDFKLDILLISKKTFFFYVVFKESPLVHPHI